MAKKICHLPLQKIKEFIKQNRTIQHKLTSDKELREFYTILGKAHYQLELERYIKFIHLEKTPQKALQSINYFQSDSFITQVCLLLNLEHKQELF